jgi:hypothetical protein
MSKQALKERLGEKVQNIETITASPQEETSNIVPFNKGENSQSISVVPDFAITLNEAKQRLVLLQNFVREMMIPEIDYGVIPGCKKPSLYKSGAEKLCDIFALSKHVEVINRLEDWENKIFHFEVKAVLINKRTGHIEAEGIGCCCNKEKKYSSHDAYNVINTILKMAKKRALIDAVLSATRSSGIFTQDIEDYSSNTGTDNTQYKSHEENNKIKSTPVSKEQLMEILNIILYKKIPIEKAKNLINEKYKVSESKQLTSAQAIDFLSYLKEYRAV